MAMTMATATARSSKLRHLFFMTINIKKMDTSTMMAHARVKVMSTIIIMMMQQKSRKSTKTSTSLLLSFMSLVTY
jgi:hypothetical protein